MRKFVRTSIILAAAMALALTGCRPPLNLVRPGGDGFVTGGSGIQVEPEGKGGMNVTIKWPPPIERAVQAIPAVANTIHLKVSTREGVVKASRFFNDPATTESLVSTASLSVGVGSSLIVEVNAYRQQFATDSVGVLPTAEQIIAQGTQENVTVTLNATTSVRLQLDPDVTLAGRGGAASLGLDQIPWQLIDYDPRGPAVWTELNDPQNLTYDPVGKYLYFTERPDPGRNTEGYRIMRLSLFSDTSTGSYGLMTLVAGGAALNSARQSETAVAPFTTIENLRTVASDATGNLYYTEQGLQNRIRKLAPNGVVTNFAQGLINPEGMLAHGDRLYVADGTGNRVYAYDSVGSPLWTAGGGTESSDGASTSFIPLASASIPGPSALAVWGNSLYVASTAGRVLEINLGVAETPGSNAIRTLTAVAGETPGAVAQDMDETTFGALGGIAASGGDLYLSDITNRGVWKVPADPEGSVTATAARVTGFQPVGTNIGQFNTPTGLLLVGTTLYVCDTGNNRIQQVDTGTLATTHFAGRSDALGEMIDGPSVYGGQPYATLWGPRAIATRSVGTSMVVADTGSARLRGVTTTGYLSTLLGYWNLSRLSRGVGLDAHNLHLGPIAALALQPTTGATAPRLYALTSDDDDDAGGQAVYRIDGLDNPAFGPRTYQMQQVNSVVTTRMLFENMASRIGSTFPRVVDDPTGIGVSPRTGDVVFSVAGTYHSLLRWDGVSPELTYSAGTLPAQGYFKFAGTGAQGYNGEGPATLVQVSQPRRVRFDQQGNCYFLAVNASGASILRRVSSSEPDANRWKISTIAGGGTQTVPQVTASAPPVSAVLANLGAVADFDIDSQGNIYLASGTRIYRMDQRAATMTEVYNSTNRNFTSIAFDENDAAIIFTYAEEQSKIKKVYLSRLF